MPGKFTRIKLILFLLIVVNAWPGPVFAAGGQEATVAILLSDSEEAYAQPATVFREEIGRPAQVFNLHGDISHDPALKERLLAERPSLIFALGAKAAYVAKLWTEEKRDIPIIFAMVLNWQRYQLLEGRDNIAGIAAEMAPGTQFVNMTMFSPAVRRIGLIYSLQSVQIYEQAEQAASLLGLTLVAEPIERSKEFQRAFKKISGDVDAFWVLNDPVVYTLENLDFLGDRCINEKLLCMGQMENIARMGLTLSVNPDARQIGAQAAAMARNILEHGQRPTELGVMDPLGTQISVNLTTAGRIGLEISPHALDMATFVIGR
jgi:ABC-type uncharacterized transport system substrate-binding protein